ncbi:fructose-bisphosphatase class II family protein [Spiroplasma turonicum]|uniref:fructose-bisphosphatase n=1 Tax=Spiroplasma turonicum TaxID=216946 RepID=A0A0K1P752_9MOLU|nr:fructose-bisphosphatase class II family protein [Spiroplasma turonicum]AKU80115.1 fructose 1,6-bisphosphatase II [Spiroplasma turonicum]ALX71115.1 fructose 1,6-bisphosphatase II [Spiroplasma turonicum]
MNKDIILLRTVEVAAIASYKYIGMKDKNMVDQAAVEAFEVMLRNERGFKLKVVNGEGELDNAPMLYVNQFLGDLNDPEVPTFDVSVDPIEGTNPAAYNFAGSISTISISRENTMLQMPEMYMEKFFVKDKYSNLINLSEGIINNVLRLQEFENRKDLRCIILDKPRHNKIIQELSKLGVVTRLIQDGDVLAAIDVVNGEADFVYGIGGAPEGCLMASLALASGCKMQSRLINYNQIWPNEKETESRMEKENAWMSKHNIDTSSILSDYDLVSDERTRFFAAGLTAGGSLKPIKYKKGKFFVNGFMASHGIVRNFSSIYDVNKVNNLKPDIKYLFDKYKR